jgi:NAD-dependent SIR2 family protein deacetylase
MAAACSACLRQTVVFYDMAGQAAVFAEMLNKHDEVAWLKTLQ